MENFSKITLTLRLREVKRSRANLRQSMSMLSDKTSEYAEHHQHVINTLNEVEDVINEAIRESESIGKGV